MYCHRPGDSWPCPLAFKQFTGIITGVNGDPHIISWDGLKFDCQAAGEFITVTSLQDPTFQIQERFSEVSSNAGGGA